MGRLGGRVQPGESVRVVTVDSAEIRSAVLNQPGSASQPLKLGRESGAVQFAVPGNLTAGLVELSF